jgi:hypothetical protein
MHELFDFVITNVTSEDDMNREVINITRNSNIFDLARGRVFRCQIFRRTDAPSTSIITHGFLLPDDVIMFNVHHSVFDGTSNSIFLQDLSLAYNGQSRYFFDHDELQYFDYAVQERLIDMSSARHFWHTQLDNYDFQRTLSLPTDRHRSSADQRSGDSASITWISFDDNISQAFFDYASTHHLTPFQLGLATFYAFLFKLSSNRNDMCITCLNANRYRNELQNMIGMFVATLPHRLRFEGQWTFDELVKHVQDKCLSILTHAQYPLQQILADQQVNQLDVSFLELVFDFITTSSDTHLLSLNDAAFESVPFLQQSQVAKFDFMLTFIDDPSSMNERLSFRLVCSHDLFDEATVGIMARRFQQLINYLFMDQANINDSGDSLMLRMNTLSLILSEEADEIQQTVFDRKNNALDKGKGLQGKYFCINIDCLIQQNIDYVLESFVNYELIFSHI